MLARKTMLGQLTLILILLLYAPVAHCGFGGGLAIPWIMVAYLCCAIILSLSTLSAIIYAWQQKLHAMKARYEEKIRESHVQTISQIPYQIPYQAPYQTPYQTPYLTLYQTPEALLTKKPAYITIEDGVL